MTRTSPLVAAFRTAFARSRGQPAVADTAQQQVHPAALAFVVGFPGVVGVLALLAALSRAGPRDGAFPLAIGLLALAGLLFLLGARSVVAIGQDDVTVRFFALRSTTVKFRDLTSATLGLAFPSISYAIALTDRYGRKALVHANWWRNEAAIVLPVCRALIEFDVPMDRATARVVSQLLDVKRPKTQVADRRPW